MDLNILAMLLYLLITAFIIVVVGKLFFKWGKHYLHGLLEESTADSINKALLVGYYLFNIGYAMLMLQGWVKVENILSFTNSIAVKSGWIIMLLGVMHYINVIGISIYQRIQQNNF